MLFFNKYLIDCNSQVSSGELYDVNLNVQNGFYNINYYPTSTNPSYTGENFLSLEDNDKLRKITLITDCQLMGESASLNDCWVYPGSPSNNILRGDHALIIPKGVTLVISGSPKIIPILIIKGGRVVMDPYNNSVFSFFKMHIFSDGIFESAPVGYVNHTILVKKPDTYTISWERSDIPTILSIDGNVTIRGADSSSTWTGFERYNRTTFIRSFPYPVPKPFLAPVAVIKLGGIRDSKGVEQYSLDHFYTKMTSDSSSGKYAYDPVYTPNTGHILINPYNKNVWLRCYYKCSMVFTGSSTVDIQNSVFYDFGHTTSIELNQYYNTPNRYPITLLHNKKSVNIQNNCFLPAFSLTNQSSLIPRSFIGATRSFGNIIGNSFVLNERYGYTMSGISLLYGTEQFNISFNSFISLYPNTAETPTSGQYPDIDNVGSGIITTSPYSLYESNVFEGRFKGGAIHVIPLQSRSTIAGLESDRLLGIYEGYQQSNLDDQVSNILWNKVVFKDNVFFGESEFRVTYPMTIQPPIKINFLRGWYINQRPSAILPPNEANVDYSYDSSLIGCDLRKYTISESNTLSGKCNSVSLKNSDLTFSYAFFADSFRCNYISIVDSKFSQQIKDGDNSINFIKKFTKQLYLSNVNGTKVNRLDSILALEPFYQLSPKSMIGPSLNQNSFNFTFIPNFESTSDSVQFIETIIDEVYQNGTFMVSPASGSSIQTKSVQLPQSANGPYTVALSSFVGYGNNIFNISVGSYFAGTYIVDNSAYNFYLGIDLSPIADLSSSPPRALSIFGHQWTKCNWIQPSNKCTTTGILLKNSITIFIPPDITNTDELSMLETYLGNDVTNNIPSTLNLSLPGPHQYKFYLYSYNSDWVDLVINPIPSFSIKINGKYQEPITRLAPTYLTYKKYGPFFWNNLNSTEQTLSIEWASDNIKYSIPLCGIEIYSSVIQETPTSLYNSSKDLYKSDGIDLVFNNEGEFYNIDYFPNSTNSNYAGDNFYSLENSKRTIKVSLLKDCLLNGTTSAITNCNFRITTIDGYSNNAIDINPSSNSLLLVKGNVTIIVPPGITLTISGSPRLIPSLVVKGRVLLDSNNHSTFKFYKMQVLANGIFESTPNQKYNHTIIAQQTIDVDIAAWDRVDIPSILSISGNITIRGFDSNSTWSGFRPLDRDTFLRSFTFTSFLPIIKLSGPRNPNGIEQYQLDSYYTSIYEHDIQISDPSSFIGYILVNPYNKNVWIKGFGNCSMVFTGSSTVDIQNSVFYDFGHTTSSPLHQIYNIPNRYPITLYHNKKSVNIQNNCFIPAIHAGIPQNSSTPRSFIGATRSFGNIIGNSFVLKESSTGLSMSGISLLYGTEQFNISFNSFISVYSNTTTPSTSRQYPDIDYIGSGIITTSPYSSLYDSNIFEGRFKGGAIHVIPLQSRSTIAGLESDRLLGIYEGYQQSNLDDQVSNILWNKVVFKDNVFFGESEFRVTYPMTIQPPIKINFLRGWYINQRPSAILPPNEANVDYSYDSSLVKFTLKPMPTSNIVESNTLSGKCNSVSLKNSDLSFSYAFFADSFRCNYISIVDSTFTQKINLGNDSINFIKRFTKQLYLSNVNGTKINKAYLGTMNPFYQLSPKSIIEPPLTQNSFNFTFIPNFDGFFNRSQLLETITDDVQNDTVINPGTYQLYSKFIQLPQSANGPYTVALSTRINPIPPYDNFAPVGLYFAGTYIVDNSANNFYLGIDLSPIADLSSSPPPRALSIFGKQWTKCNWIQPSNKCTTTGLFSQSATTMTAIPNEITEYDEISMLTSYLGNDVTNNVPSTLNLSLPGPHQYKFYLYSYNSDWVDSIINPIPSFSIKINGKYQEPITRLAPTYLTYKKYGPFFWNNLNSTEQTLSIEWASDNIKYSIPLCGIEIYSSIQTSFPIPVAA
ncbi:hypothetical protein ACTA71_011074 [Dictyostelium dimigraforme]